MISWPAVLSLCALVLIVLMGADTLWQCVRIDRAERETKTRQRATVRQHPHATSGPGATCPAPGPQLRGVEPGERRESLPPSRSYGPGSTPEPLDAA